MILCLTVTDLVSSSLGLVGALVLELRQMAWMGSSQGCAAYYFLSSWLVGLSHYLTVLLLCPASIKRFPCQLLLCLLVFSLLPAAPELTSRSTVRVSERQAVCILATSSISHTLHLILRMAVRQLLPALLVILSSRYSVMARSVSFNRER